LSSRKTLIAAILGLIVAGGTIAFAAQNLVSSQEGSGVVDFESLTPVAFEGYPEDAGKPSLGIDEEPTCKAAQGERPRPDAPPLSCRYSGSEPPEGSIHTPKPDEIPDATAIATTVPAPEWMAITNELFRLTFAIPQDWYSTMRPEGGEFRIYDAVRAAKIAAKGETNLRGGISGVFFARELSTVDVPGFPPPLVEGHLQTPNTSFGDVEGAIWEDPSGHGTALTLHAAFARDGVVFEIVFRITDDGRTKEAIDADAEIARRILTTITPF
jgi:hypothetical protein